MIDADVAARNQAKIKHFIAPTEHIGTGLLKIPGNNSI
jgi:hypothetical protein